MRDSNWWNLPRSKHWALNVQLQYRAPIWKSEAYPICDSSLEQGSSQDQVTLWARVKCYTSIPNSEVRNGYVTQGHMA